MIRYTGREVSVVVGQGLGNGQRRGTEGVGEWGIIGLGGGAGLVLGMGTLDLKARETGGSLGRRRRRVFAVCSRCGHRDEHPDRECMTSVA
jgi:hypothetical protein